jgi:hypothetical protein
MVPLVPKSNKIEKLKIKKGAQALLMQKLRAGVHLHQKQQNQ